jgi:hypothetical protein
MGARDSSVTFTTSIRTATAQSLVKGSLRAAAPVATVGGREHENALEAVGYDSVDGGTAK